MRIVLDTNVIIAAFAGRGLCAEIFEVCLSEHTIVISGHILSEVREKLTDKIYIPQKTVQNIIGYLSDIAEIVEPEPIDKSICRDKDDNEIIGTTTSGNAKFIITGDYDLLMRKNYKNIGIITPREFWLLLRQSINK